jgi:hypothetical protein
MQLINELRERFRIEMDGFFIGLKGMAENEIVARTRFNWEGWGIHLKAHRRFGETLIIEGEWDEEDVSIQININPDTQMDDFRVLYRWRPLGGW